MALVKNVHQFTDRVGKPETLSLRALIAPSVPPVKGVTTTRRHFFAFVSPEMHYLKDAERSMFTEQYFDTKEHVLREKNCWLVSSGQRTNRKSTRLNSSQ